MPRKPMTEDEIWAKMQDPCTPLAAVRRLEKLLEARKHGMTLKELKPPTKCTRCGIKLVVTRQKYDPEVGELGSLDPESTDNPVLEAARLGRCLSCYEQYGLDTTPPKPR